MLRKQALLQLPHWGAVFLFCHTMEPSCRDTKTPQEILSFQSHLSSRLPTLSTRQLEDLQEANYRTGYHPSFQPSVSSMVFAVTLEGFQLLMQCIFSKGFSQCCCAKRNPSCRQPGTSGASGCATYTVCALGVVVVILAWVCCL